MQTIMALARRQTVRRPRSGRRPCVRLGDWQCLCAVGGLAVLVSAGSSRAQVVSREVAAVERNNLEMDKPQVKPGRLSYFKCDVQTRG